MDAKKLAGLLALLALAAGTSLLLPQADDEEPGAAAAPELGIGYYVDDATLTGTGDDGHVLYRMSAARVVQQPGDGTVTMEHVAVNYDPARSIPWRLTADTGEVLADGKMIALSGNVVATTREADSPSATIRTDYLEFDPGADIASTDRKVVIDYAGSTVHAVGMRALLREDRLQLRADVAGHYVR